MGNELAGVSEGSPESAGCKAPPAKGRQDGYVTFTIENTETGETREVTANDVDDLGRRIADGDFDDDDYDGY